MNDLTTEEKPCILLVRRTQFGWEIAPYPKVNRERSERLAKWLRNIFTDIEETKVVEI